MKVTIDSKTGEVKVNGKLLKDAETYLELLAVAINITLDSSSTLTLTGDSYITSLNNEVTDNSNINLNGHTLYMDGTAITSTNYKGATTLINQNTSTTDVENNTQDSFDLKIILLPILAVIVVISMILVFDKKAKKDNK